MLPLLLLLLHMMQSKGETNNEVAAVLTSNS